MKKCFFLIFVLLILFIGCLSKTNIEINVESGFRGGNTRTIVCYIFSGEEIFNGVYDDEEESVHIFIDSINIKKNKKYGSQDLITEGPYPKIIYQEAMRQLELKKEQWIKKFPNKQITVEDILYIGREINQDKVVVNEVKVIGLFIRYKRGSNNWPLFFYPQNHKFKHNLIKLDLK